MNWRRWRAYLRVVAHAFEMTLRQNLVDAFVLFGVLVQPIIIAVLAFWMLRDRGGDYVIFVVVGSAMTGLWSSLLFVSGNSINYERWVGTLELLVGVPTPMPVVVFGKNLAHVLQSLSSMVVSYTLAAVVFGATPRVEHPLLFAVSIALMVVAFVSFGLVISAVFVLNPDVQRFQNGLEFPVYILSGFLFPIALLPGWTTPFSYLLAPYWAAQALHGTSSGGVALTQIYFDWGMLLLFSLIYLFLAGRMYRRLLYKARQEATLVRQ